MSRTTRKKAPHCLRSPKTQQERRESLAAKEDGVPWRARRNAKNVPSAWDEKIVSAIYEFPRGVS